MKSHRYFCYAIPRVTLLQLLLLGGSRASACEAKAVVVVSAKLV